MKERNKRRSDNLDDLNHAAEAYKQIGVVGGKPCSVPVEKIDRTQNIRDVDIESLGFISLKESIQTEGLLQRPIVVKTKEDMLECVGGHRRIVALIELGYETIPCILLNVDPNDRKKIQLIKLAENVVREDLAPLDLADAILKAKVDLDETATGLGRVLRKDRKYIARLIKIAQWPKSVRAYILKEGVPLKILTQVAARTVANADLLQAIKDARYKKIGASANRSRNYIERRDNYFEERKVPAEHRQAIVDFLTENNIRGWF